MGKQVHITLSDEAIKELEQLKSDLKLPTIAETIRASISLTKFLEMEKENGNEIVLRNENSGKERVIVTFK